MRYRIRKFQNMRTMDYTIPSMFKTTAVMTVWLSKSGEYRYGDWHCIARHGYNPRAIDLAVLRCTYHLHYTVRRMYRIAHKKGVYFFWTVERRVRSVSNINVVWTWIPREDCMQIAKRCKSVR